MPLFDRKSPIGFEVFCHKSNRRCDLRRMVSLTHKPNLLVKNRPNATENRPTSTQNRPDATFLCHLATLLSHSVQLANSGLRQIACDFLTAGNRVGAVESDPIHRICLTFASGTVTIVQMSIVKEQDVLADLRTWRDEFARTHDYDLAAMAATLVTPNSDTAGLPRDSLLRSQLLRSDVASVFWP